MSTLESLEKRLADLGIEIELVRSRRLGSQAELRRLSALAEKGDNKAKYAQEAVNKRVEADSTLIVSLEREVGHVKRQVDLARGQLAAIAARKHADETAGLPRDRLFEIACPDGRHVRHRHNSLESLRKALQPGYSIAGQVFDANADDNGGFVASIAPGAKSTMSGLLEAHGAELLAFLAEHGVMTAAERNDNG
ncbi:MAG: hypothetical protein WA624_08120 [Methylocella sp.]